MLVLLDCEIFVKTHNLTLCSDGFSVSVELTLIIVKQLNASFASKTDVHHSMPIYNLKNIPAKFRLDPIWNDGP